MAKKDKHVLPTILSFFFPGLGQIIKGHIGKGLLFILAMIVSFVMTLIAIGFILIPIVWVWNLYDAYNSD